MRGRQQEKRKQKEGKPASVNELVNERERERKGGKEKEGGISGLSEQRCALYRIWTYPAVPSIQLCPETLQTNNHDSGWPLSHPQAAFIRPHSFTHSSISPLLRCFKPTNYHQLPPDGLCSCSCFSWPFKNGPALISQLLQIKREVSGDYSKPSWGREREGSGRGSPRFTPRESKSTACHLWGCPRVWYGDSQE